MIYMMDKRKGNHIHINTCPLISDPKGLKYVEVDILEGILMNKLPCSCLDRNIIRMYISVRDRVEFSQEILDIWREKNGGN